MIAYIKFGDELPDLTTTLKDCDTGLPIDLTTAVSAQIRIRSATEGTTVTEASAAFLSPRTEGRLQYSWPHPNTLAVGNYYVEWEVMWPSSKPKTYPTTTYNMLTVLPVL